MHYLLHQLLDHLRDTPHTWAEWSCSQLLQNTPLHPIADWGRPTDRVLRFRLLTAAPSGEEAGVMEAPECPHLRRTTHPEPGANPHRRPPHGYPATYTRPRDASQPGQNWPFW
jgi:hypothetical protein